MVGTIIKETKKEAQKKGQKTYSSHEPKEKGKN